MSSCQGDVKVPEEKSKKPFLARMRKAKRSQKARKTVG
jgi:hypothetical protein